jgi:AAA+ ATPase superfamily predicted ATPase
MMKNKFIGREKEQAILNAALESGEAEMVAVIGRRRVGKTFLIKTAYALQLDFEVTGVQNAPLSEQLQNFAFRINTTFYSGKAKLRPRNWMDAFQMLILALEAVKKKEKKVVFLDELPWFDSQKSGFIRALGFFWNSWAVNQEIVVVICGSAASWMIQKVVYDKGGLHNRITRRIDVEPFNLYETEQFLQSRNVNLNRYQIIHLYLAMGGIPHYLKEVEAGKSPAENIDKICFTKSGILTDEFLKLYPALFEEADNHLSIIRALAQKWKGLTRKELLELSKLSDGGNTTLAIEELISSGFVTLYYPFGKTKKDILYRLTDEYSLFYLHFIEPRKQQGKNIWQDLSQTQFVKSWSGYAFESLCMKHIDQIKKALGISGVYVETSSFLFKGNDTEKGIQVDLLLDRKDQIINLFEIKFYNEIWQLDKAEATLLREKIAIFKRVTKTKKHIFLTVLATFGMRPNANSLGLVDRVIDLEALFEVV